MHIPRYCVTLQTARLPISISYTLIIHRKALGGKVSAENNLDEATKTTPQTLTLLRKRLGDVDFAALCKALIALKDDLKKINVKCNKVMKIYRAHNVASPERNKPKAKGKAKGKAAKS